MGQIQDGKIQEWLTARRRKRKENKEITEEIPPMTE
jgi:hypothetical protein